MEHTGAFAPWLFLALFSAASYLMIWRLEAMTADGVEGTVLGTLVMPYCSGIGNIIFTFLIAQRGTQGSEVITNALVNNVTNLTLLLGLPTIIWGMDVGSRAKGRKKQKGKNDASAPEMHRLSMLLTLTAVLFFTGTLWALSRDNRLDFSDGLVLTGLFLFWQCFHVFEVLKENARQKRGWNWRLPLNLALLGIGTYGIYVSTNWLVDWVSGLKTGLISVKYLGWLSGWLMVLPNAILAFYYARQGKPEVVYTSQVGDGHICIPLCVGIIAMLRGAVLPASFSTGVTILMVSAAFHLFWVALLGRLPRWTGWVLVAAYLLFLYQGLLA